MMFLSYLTAQERDTDSLELLLRLFFLVSGLTLMVLITSYFSIKFYLQSKHSQSIKIAERISNNPKRLSFKKIIFGFLLAFFSCIFLSFYVNMTGATTSLDCPPITIILNNFTCNLLIAYYVLLKKEIVEFIKRKAKLFANNINLKFNRVSPI